MVFHIEKITDADDKKMLEERLNSDLAKKD